AIEEFAAFLIQFLGGPGEDTQRRWWLSLRESHLRFRIGKRERNAWMSLMAKALDEAQIEEPARHVLREFFEHSSRYVINTVNEEAAGGCAHPELAKRWDAQRVLDEAVAAVRTGDADRAITLAQRTTLSPAVFVGLLAAMIGRGERVLLEYVR